VFTVTAVRPLSVEELDVVVAAPVGASALCWANSAPGSFLWTPSGGNNAPVTYGNVTPTAALREATGSDPTTGGPAARLAFATPDPNGTPTLGGSLALATPSATGAAGGTPGVYAAPAVWSALGVRFILWWNASSPLASGPFDPTEATDLVQEYALSTLYENAEWVVLSIPLAGVGATPASPASTGGAG